jgi:hypothetical protein
MDRIATSGMPSDETSGKWRAGDVPSADFQSRIAVVSSIVDI